MFYIDLFLAYEVNVDTNILVTTNSSTPINTPSFRSSIETYIDTIYTHQSYQGNES